LTEDDEWQEPDPPARGPSTPPDLDFDPLATGIGVFAAVAIPIAVVGYTRSSGVNGTIIAVGVVLGLLPFYDRSPERHPLRRPKMACAMVALVAVFVLFPLGFAVYISLTDWPLIGRPQMWQWGYPIRAHSSRR